MARPWPSRSAPWVPTARARSGGVFTPASPWTLVADTRARRVGDVITVILSETTQASKRTGTQIDKGSRKILLSVKAREMEEEQVQELQARLDPQLRTLNELGIADLSLFPVTADRLGGRLADVVH